MGMSWPVRTFGLSIIAALLFDAGGTGARGTGPQAVDGPPLGLPAEHSVAGRAVPAGWAPPDPELGASFAMPRQHWPVAGAAEITLAGARAVRADALPVEISPVADPGAPSPTTVGVELLDDAGARDGGEVGLAVRVTPRDGGTGPVRLTVDYAGFRNAYGANFADRLRLARVRAGAAPVLLDTDNDLSRGRLSARIDPSHTDIYRVVSTASGTGSGDFRATDLSPAGKWQVGPQSGAFAETYPLDLPPSVGGEGPDLALGYDSSSVDGRTSATNNQASWVGLGWGLGVGFIERRYRSCVDDGDPFHADLCWQSPYPGEEDGAAYVISLDGVTSELIRTADGTYRMRDDNGWRVEHLTGGPNGDNTGEYWVVSTPDGERHTFGNRTDSNWTVPVVGDDAGEPCRATAPVPCRQTWRWNLDRIVDADENVTSVYWTRETNNYKQANGGATHRYDRGGQLDRIEYGMLDGEHPTALVDFTATPRCVQRVNDPTAACPAVSAAAAASYPDVPVDLICADGASCTKPSPSFFGTSRLESISSKVWDVPSRTWRDVSSWVPRFAFPATPDGTSPSLWLNSIQESGVFGTEPVTLPATTFDGIFKINRQDWTSPAQQLNMRRLNVIRNGLGGEVRVTYEHGSAAATCPAGGENAGWEAGVMWDQNRYECFRVRFKPEGATAPVKGVFHKYVVTRVEEVDTVAGSPPMITTYEYGVDQLVPWPAWHRDDELLVALSDMDWTDWRGYQTVRIAEGGGGADRQTITELRHFRGMNGDLLGSGSARTENVVDYTGRAWPDDPQLAGFVLQEQRFRLEPGGSRTELESTRHTYWDSGIIADGPGRHDVRMVRAAYTYARDRRGDNTWRETSELHDGYTVANGGLPRRKVDFGETGVADSTCTEIDYAQNTEGGHWMLTYVEREEEHSGDPDGTSGRCLGPIATRTITLYDGATGPGDGVNEPTDGNPTETRRYTANAAYIAVRNTYDSYGRELTETEASGTTRTAYTPATGFPTGGVAVTDPVGFVTTEYPSRAFDDANDRTVDANGLATQLDYDGLGRLRRVWLPTEPTGGGIPSFEFSYRITAGKPSVITAKRLQSLSGANAVWLTTHTYEDGLGRTRETQERSPGPSGGRTVTVTLYDDRGLTRGTSAPLWNAGAPADNPDLLLNPATTAIPSFTETTYDALERDVVSTVYAYGTARARTVTARFGNGSVVTPPVGASTGTWLDGHDRKVTVQHDIAPGSGLPRAGAATTAYTYTARDELASITDPAGNTTSYTYDWLGHRLTANDPDAGRSTATYDITGRLKSTVDALGRKLSYTYDPLDRQRVVWLGEEQGGTKLADWTYDTVPGAKGQLAAAVRYVGGNAYRTEITGYDHRYRPTGRRWTIPPNETGLAGTYDIGYAYDRADHVTDTTYPAVGGLPAETVHQTYTQTGDPATLSSALDTYVANTAYSGSGQLAGRDYGSTGSVRRTWTYEDGGAARLAGMTTVTGATTVQNDTYTYDDADNPRRVMDVLTGQSQCFTYDAQARLTASWTTTADCTAGLAAADNGGPDPFREQYTMDIAGNLRSVTSDGTTRGYTYPAPGAARPHAVTSVGADTYGYDIGGAMTTRTVAGITTAFTYDEFSRLATTTTAGATTTYTHDADGNRLLVREPDSATLYLDDMELRSNGSGTTATRHYSSDGDLIAQRHPTGLTWLMTDHQDSIQLAIRATADSARTTQNGVTRQRYLPYGAHRGGRDDIPDTNHGYLGKVEDNTGLVALDHREHDPAIARLTSPDPLLVDEELNPYAYGGNNPVTRSDPTGLCSNVVGCDYPLARRPAKKKVRRGGTVCAPIYGCTPGAKRKPRRGGTVCAPIFGCSPHKRKKARSAGRGCSNLGCHFGSIHRKKKARSAADWRRAEELSKKRAANVRPKPRKVIKPHGCGPQMPMACLSGLIHKHFNKPADSGRRRVCSTLGTWSNLGGAGAGLLGQSKWKFAWRAGWAGVVISIAGGSCQLASLAE